MPRGIHMIGRHLSSEVKKKISDTLKKIGHKPPIHYPNERSLKNLVHGGRKGIKQTPESNEKRRKSLIGLKRYSQRGEKHYCWNGGKSRGKHGTPEYKEWRLNVFGRDGYTCQDCGARGVYLYAHHIKPWSKFIELRYVISNGITLCMKCHAKVDQSFANFHRKELI